MVPVAGDQARGCCGRQPPPELGAVGLLDAQARALAWGSFLHEAVPVARCATPPAPAVAEGVEGELALAATASGEDSLAPEQGCHPLAQGFGPCCVAPEQRDGKGPLGIHHHHGRVLVFALQQRSNQPGHQAAGSHHHKALGAAPLGLEQFAGSGR